MRATPAEPGVAKLMDLKSDPIMTTPTSLLQAKTKAHYDAHPIEFLSLDEERNIAAWQPRPFREFVEGFLKTGQRGGCFDAVVSDGVIHHTPDAPQAFRENARLVRDGGHMYVAVYRRHRYY